MAASGSSIELSSRSSNGLISRAKYGCSFGSGLDAWTYNEDTVRRRDQRDCTTNLGKVRLVDRSVPFTQRRVDDVVTQGERVNEGYCTDVN